ncbi:chaplin [Kitasatospora purpeofusca]|uniref:chaplin n=1 Tax=Kitasatospora purpeofusca TaxID=67352 RepID=UPI003664B9E8|nr:LAXTG-anchored chaplin ChpA [Kitasatospora purpeofusca]
MRNAAKKGLLTAVATGSVLASTAGYASATAGAEGAAVGSPGVASGNSVQVPVEVPINACGNTVDVVGVLNPAYGNNCANASGHHGGGAHAGGGKSASGSSASGAATGSPGVAAGNSVQAPVHIPVNACGNSVDVVGAANPAFGNDCANTAAPAHTAPPVTPDEDCPEEHGPHNPPPPATTGHPSTPPVTQTPSSGETTQGTPRNGGPSEATPSGGGATGASGTATTPASAPGVPQARPAAARTGSPSAAPTAATAGSQLASTGAGDTELLGAAGLALLIGGGVLYRRARAGAR